MKKKGSDMKRVGVVLPPPEYFSPLNGGAVARWVFETYVYLKGEYDVTIFCQPSSPHWSKDFHVRYIHTSVLRPLLSKIPKIQRYLHYLFPLEVALRMRGTYDVVHVHNRPTYIPIIKRLNPGTKVILHMHNDHLKNLDGIKLDRVLSNVDLVVACSEYIKKGILERCPSMVLKVRAVYNGVNTMRFVPSRDKNSQTSFNILFVGRLTEEKGVHILIEAIKNVVAHIPRVRLVVAGSSWYNDDSNTPYVKKLKKQATKLGNNIVFTGYIKHEGLPPIYQEATIFVCPSIWEEPFGLVNLEAMASGLPVIASNRGGIPEVIGDAGILIDPYDINSLSKNIITVLGDKGLRKRLGRKARKRVEQLFTWQIIASQFEGILKELVSSA